MERAEILNSVKIIHSRRARHLRISVSPDKQVSLTIPRRVSEGEGIRFLNSKKEWIEKTLSKMKPRKKGKWEFKFSDGETIFFFGLPHQLHFSTDSTYPYVTQNQKSKIKNQNEKQLLPRHSEHSEESSVMIQEDPSSLKLLRMTIVTPNKKKIFENFLSNKLREHIYGFAYKFCKENGFAFRDLKIKKIVSRWGSCSSKGNLNFSIRLVHFDREVINYVIIHELCHTKEMNHSRKFWALVSKYCPEYKTYIKELK